MKDRRIQSFQAASHSLKSDLMGMQRFIALMGLVSLVVGGCSTPPQSTKSESLGYVGQDSEDGKPSSHTARSKAKTYELAQVNSLLVLPIVFEANARGAERNAFALNQELEESLRQDLGITVTSMNDALNAVRKSTDAKKVSDILAHPSDTGLLAQSIQADGVIKATVHEFKERVGSQVGSDSPAMISLSVQLQRSSDGKELWQSSHHFEDKALSENLLELKSKSSLGPKGLAFSSGIQLLKSGLQKCSEELSEKRMNQFVKDGSVPEIAPAPVIRSAPE